MRTEATPPTLVLTDLPAAACARLHGAVMRAELAAELAAGGIRVQAMETRFAVRNPLRAEGEEARPATVNQVTSVADTADSPGVAIRNPEPEARNNAA